MKIGKESEKLEFKKTTAELKEGVISMAAILNKHGGGELYFGVRNDGTVLGQTVTDKTLRDVSQAVSNHIEPRAYPKIELVYIDDKQCVRVEFTGNDAPYFAYGRAYVRVADEDKVMVPTEIEAFYLRKSAGRDSWDSELSGKSSNDIEDTVLKDYLERANQAERIGFAFVNCGDTLDKLGVTNGNLITNAACAMFLGMPLLEVQMAVFATKQKLTFLDISRGSGNIRQLIEIAVRYIIDNMRWRVVLDGSLQRKEIPEAPIAAIREAVTNSFCHRDYRSSQNNEVAIYSDRIEIYNPGRFPDGQTPEDFIRGKGRSTKRNPNIAQLLYYSKDIESFGTGLQRIAAACADANVRVEFERSDIGFAVIFFRPVNHINVTEEKSHYNSIGDSNINNVGDSIADNDGDSNVNNVGDDVGDSIGDNVGDNVGNNVGNSIGDNVGDKLNETQVKIIELMLKDAAISAKTIAGIIKITPRNVERNINTLKQSGLIERVGSPKGGHWVVKKGV
ncbi:MAG: putative DNA binding domain-containing protein [Synergistaceae bacterium]|nr:putative DNA binding domain-containing protein [Synergistaceae bacterium]